MGSNTKIEWVKNEDGTQGETWNPISGCTPISSGCKNCYARAMMKRFAGKPGWPDSPDTVTLFPERLEQPFRWRKPRRVFVNSMSDLFHKDVPYEFVTRVFATMASNRKHVFQILTKRPNRMLEFFEGIEFARDRRRLFFANTIPWPLPNVHLGVSCEDQPTADERIPLLLQTPAAKRFVSIEPCLSDINIRPYLERGSQCICDDYIDTSDGCTDDAIRCNMGTRKLDGVIVGAETGPGARPMELDWARSIRDQCQSSGTKFFFKKDSNGNRELDGQLWEGVIK